MKRQKKTKMVFNGIDRRRDPEPQYAAYMRDNPFYWQELNRRPVEVSEGHILVWAAVVEQAIMDATAPVQSAESVQQEIYCATYDKSLKPQDRYEKLHELQCKLTKIRYAEWDRASALNFLQSPLFRFICTECDINPEAAERCLEDRFQKRQKLRSPIRLRKYRERIAGYAGR